VGHACRRSNHQRGSSARRDQCRLATQAFCQILARGVEQFI
jgi:hypothetical protein